MAGRGTDIKLSRDVLRLTSKNAKNWRGESAAEEGQNGTETAPNHDENGTKAYQNSTEAYRNVPEEGGLAVIASERHESGRVDRQLFGRAARQGDPGRAQAFVSLEDELVVQHAPKLRRLLLTLAKKDNEPQRNWLLKKLFRIAQNKAQRLALSQRRSVLRNDDWLDESLGFAGTE